MFVLKFDENTKAILMNALDIYSRQIGADLSKAGGAAAAEAAMKLIGVHNVAIAIQTAQPQEESKDGEAATEKLE